MALIKNLENIIKSDVRIKIPVEIKKEIEDYCNWAQIEEISHFITEAARFVLKKDSEWKKYKRSISNIEPAL
ncbi:MAG: hypothetical protein ACKOAD_08070 [Gammaproteobacteria bacterium]